MAKQPPRKPLPGKKKQRKPLGPAIEWNDADFEALTQISPTDLKAASALWQGEALKSLQGLLDAQVQEEL
jgi:hypothetical protein